MYELFGFIIGSINYRWRTVVQFHGRVEVWLFWRNGLQFDLLVTYDQAILGVLLKEGKRMFAKLVYASCF